MCGTRDKGIILHPQSHSFDCFVAADFCGDWDRVNADVDPATAKSRTGYVLMYGGCPIVWASKLQKEISLSTMEAEYGALSESLRYVIHMMQIITEVKGRGWTVMKDPPKVHCKVMEDNSGCLENARLPKMRPRTKHICIKMHHFREHVRKGLVSIHKIHTRVQLADIMTKPQPDKLFETQRESLMQWDAELKTKEELSMPAQHLRACEIIDHAEQLNQLMAVPGVKVMQPVDLSQLREHLVLTHDSTQHSMTTHDSTHDSKLS